MSGGIYGGDEVSGLVFDAGSHSFRVGFAGEEYPKGDIPSYVAVQSVDADGDVEMRENAKGDNNILKKQYYVGTTKITVPRKNTEIKSFMNDGMISVVLYTPLRTNLGRRWLIVEDWDMFETLVDYSYANILHSNATEHPALFTESAWNEKGKREKLTEVMFEKYGVPAFFLAKNAVLTAFANGRTGGLVVDSGATQTSAVPVFDGYAVVNAVVRSPIGGDMVCEQLDEMLQEQNIDVIPTYKIADKEEVGEGEPARWTQKKNLPEVTQSYDRFMKKQILEDMAASMLQLCDTPIDMEYAEKLPSAPYSFPSGYTKEFLAERIKVPEGLFDLNHMRNAHQGTVMNVTQIAVAAVGMSEIDIRPTLYSGLMVTGGNSLLLGFTERLNHDLAHKCPPTIKLRVSAAVTPMERKFGAWIGGSILASLGSFQQMWIGKSEYDECGRSIVEKKCP